MNEQRDSKFLDDPEFQSLLAACLESLQRGESIDRDSLAQDCPQNMQPKLKDCTFQDVEVISWKSSGPIKT